jgi:hypothetical protein
MAPSKEEGYCTSAVARQETKLILHYSNTKPNEGMVDMAHYFARSILTN